MRIWRGDERGGVILIYTVLLTVLLGITALVIDGAILRVDARRLQASADMGATAGAVSLSRPSGGNPHRACEAAWGYVANNAAGAPLGVPSPCAPFLATPVCSLASPPVTVAGDMGPYRVSITTPVPDGDPSMQGRLDPDVDGSSCDRIAVTVERARQHLFGAVLDQGAGGVVRTSVGRTDSGGPDGTGAPLVVLDPIGCNALTASGQAQIVVDRLDDGSPGMIAIDSDGTASGGGERSCQNSQRYVVDAVGTQNSSITAQDGIDENGNPIPAVILSFALNGPGAASAYEERDVTDGRLVPRPIPGRRITRRIFDHRYNCQASNGCAQAGTVPPYIDDLRAFVGTSGVPAGFSTYTGPCRTRPSDPPTILAAGNWYVPCARLDVNNTFTFTEGNVIFEGNVNIGSSTGVFTVNATDSVDAWIYSRSDNLEKDAQSSVRMNRTMVYLHAGVISFGAGTGALIWSAPHDGDFEDLSLWSESSPRHEIGGQAALDLDGAFFTPNAWPFRFTGQGQQYQVRAQFVSFRIDVGGQGVLRLTPRADRIVPVIQTGMRLIR